jgi:hypothetical protein
MKGGNRGRVKETNKDERKNGIKEETKTGKNKRRRLLSLFYTDHRFAENYQIYSSEILSSRQLV